MNVIERLLDKVRVAYSSFVCGCFSKIFSGSGWLRDRGRGGEVRWLCQGVWLDNEHHYFEKYS